MIPVLWLCGPSGVGKTTVAWQVHTGLRAAGVASAYVDIDQLGMCYPERESDPVRYRLKARNLASVVANFAADGAACVVVSGILDPTYRVEVPGAALTLCRLTVARDELVGRFLGRSADPDAVPSVVRDADEMDASTVADVCVDTTGLSVAEVVARVDVVTSGWRCGTRVLPVVPLPSVDGPVLWVGGVPGVGTSMVGYAVYLRTMRSGRKMGYLDLRQVGFCGVGVNHRVRAANAAVVWRAYRDEGADGLVIVGEIDPDAVAHYGSAVTVCRLHADLADLADRIMPRGGRGSWPQPGDPYRGRSAAELRAAVDRAVAADAVLERAAIGVRVDSNGLDVEETVDAVLATGVWPLLRGTSRARPVTG